MNIYYYLDRYNLYISLSILLISNASFLRSKGLLVIHWTSPLFGADGGRDSGRARATIDLLHAGSAVARSITGLAVKLLASLTSGEDVVLVGEGVTPLTKYVSITLGQRAGT